MLFEGKKPYTIMYQYKRPTSIKVQCISTKCGLHKKLKIGQWYDVIESGDYFKIDDKFGSWYTYEKSLFRTIEQRRDNKLNKLFK